MEIIDLSAEDDILERQQNACSPMKVASAAVLESVKREKGYEMVVEGNDLEVIDIDDNGDEEDVDEEDEEDEDVDEEDVDEDEEEAYGGDDNGEDDVDYIIDDDVEKMQSPQNADITESARHSKRKRTSRLIKVNGFSVFKSNNYGIDGDYGLSVWDHELNSHKDDVDEEEVEDTKQNSWKPKKKQIVRIISQAAEARRKSLQDHNASIRKSLEKSLLRRQEFIRQNWKLVSPFLDPAQSCPQPCTSRETIEDIEKFKFPVLEKQPSCLQNVEMRDYQLAGVNWLIKSYSHGNSVILGDEMGLGKTLQTIAFLGWLTYHQHVSGPHLIIVPLSVIANWMNEFKRFLPQMRVLKLHSSDPNERDRVRKFVLPQLHEQYDVVVTTYEMVKNPKLRHALVTSIYWRYVILDEGHLIRHEDCIIAETVRKLHSERCLLLTGTPLQNNLHELWSLLNFLQPDLFRSAKRFDECFNITHSTKHYINKELLLKVHSLLKPFMLRRIKLDVEQTVPPKIEKKILCPLTPTQVFWYKRFLLRESTLLMQLESESAAAAVTANAKPAGKLSHSSTDNSSHVSGPNNENSANAESTEPVVNQSRWQRLRAIYMQLRKVCNHPFLFNEADPHPEYTDESIIEASGKLKVMDRLLNKLHAAGHRVVIFSQFTRVLDIIGDYLSFRGYEFCRLDGSSNRVQRQISINMFNAKNTTLFAFIMSTRAGGLGVNLQTADTVILFDSDWNPMADLQAMARVHRIGQKKVVHVYRLVAGGTVEERIVQRAEKKLFLDQVVNRDGLKESNLGNIVDSQLGLPTDQKAADNEEEGGLNTEQLLEALRFGADVICNSATAELSDYDIEQLISRQAGLPSVPSIASTAKQPLIQEGKKYSAANFDPTEAPVDTRQFQGQTFDKYGSARGRSFYNCSDNMHNIDTDAFKKDLAMENESKRQSKQRLVTVKDDFGQEHRVMKQNLYDLQSGEKSVFERELKGNSEFAKNAKDKKRHMQIAGRDYENEDLCLRCWNEGELILCDRCPASFHEQCLSKEELIGRNACTWMCPHHKCSVCKRTAGAAGGLLLRCSECPQAFCEDHVPPDAAINGRCLRMEQTGYKLPDQACYIHCSDACAAYAATYQSTVKTNVRLYNTGEEEESNIVIAASSEIATEINGQNSSTVESFSSTVVAQRKSPAKVAKITMSDINTDNLSFLKKRPVESSPVADSTKRKVSISTPSELSPKVDKKVSHSSNSSTIVAIETDHNSVVNKSTEAPPADVAPNTSLTAALSANDSGSALIRDLLRHKLPTFLATDRCEKCNKIHQNPEKCAVWFLGGRLAPYTHAKMTLQEAKDDALIGIFKNPLSKSDIVYGISVSTENSANSFMQKCSVVNLGEVILALIADNLLIPTDMKTQSKYVSTLTATNEAVSEGRRLLAVREAKQQELYRITAEKEAYETAAREAQIQSARHIIREIILLALKNPRLVKSPEKNKYSWVGYYYTHPFHMKASFLATYVIQHYNGPKLSLNMSGFTNSVYLDLITAGELKAFHMGKGGILESIPSEKFRIATDVKNNIVLAPADIINRPEILLAKLSSDEEIIRNLALLYKSFIPLKRLSSSSPSSPLLKGGVKSTITIWEILSSVENAFKTAVSNKPEKYLNIPALLPDLPLLHHVPLISQYYYGRLMEPHFGQFLRTVNVLVVDVANDTVSFRDDQLSLLYKRDHLKDQKNLVEDEATDERVVDDDDTDDDGNGNANSKDQSVNGNNSKQSASYTAVDEEDDEEQDEDYYE